MRSSPAPVDRADKLMRLRAFGLFIEGRLTYYQIAEALGIVAQNPSTAVGRARTKVDQGWRIILERRVSRWDRYWSGPYPWAAWQTLHGARLKTHPRKDPDPPAPVVTPLEQLLARIAGLEAESRALGFNSIANGLHNLCAAARYNARTATAVEKAV